MGDTDSPVGGGGQPGLALGRMEEARADTHVTVVFSNCSSRLSMADDCKYGSSLSVCLSVRSVSVLASPVLVLCGCPCPAHTLLRLLVQLLVPTPAWHWLLAGTCQWPLRDVVGGEVLDGLAVPGRGRDKGK